MTDAQKIAELRSAISENETYIGQLIDVTGWRIVDTGKVKIAERVFWIPEGDSFCDFLGGISGNIRLPCIVEQRASEIGWVVTPIHGDNIECLRQRFGEAFNEYRTLRGEDVAVKQAWVIERLFCS